MKGITFPSKEDAREYSAAMRERGWKTLVQYDSATSQWTVLVAEKLGGEAIPTSLHELIQLEEETEKREEAAAQSAGRERRKAVAKQMVRGAERETFRAGETVVSGRAFEEPLTVTSRKLNVMAGMKRAIPGTRGAHPRMGIVGVPRITEEGKGVPRISTEPKQPKIARRVPLAETGLGVAPEMRFRLFPERKGVTKEKPAAEKGGKE